ncbi:PP2C family protein-serine/threonine phosphatase [Sphaerisporangium fuscum]|uniref:PP2C family protein-serine/threonine phosphatase n=1 Tax=Sphaerisporangium fuscum TaxID=2835868 RepID=UPI001BDC99FC|nr:PP2C family protein-serine/threonine phosphatase [Sphaerisporangium fuscum]
MRVRERLSGEWPPGHALAAIPLALILFITIADILTPTEISLSPLLITAPAITASFAGPRLTGFVGALTILDEIFLDTYSGLLGRRVVQTELLALIVVTAFLVLFSYLRHRHKEVLTRVRSVSEAAQRALLRPLPNRLGSIRLASSYLAADEEAQIGGDLYAATRGDSGTRLVIGDVRGKGLASVSDVAMLLGAFREAARRDPTLPEVALHLDDSVRAEVEEHAGELEGSEQLFENFITAAVMEIPDDRPVIKLIDCGHPPPLLIRDHHVMSLQVPNPAPPLGLGELTEPGYDAEIFDFKAGDTILLYTDGVIEARCPDGRFYPLHERLSSWQGDGPETLVNYVRDDLLAHVGGRLGDDAAMVAIQRLPD